MKWDFTMTQHIFLTGKKHIGKSTLIQKILDDYKKTADGFLTVRTKNYLKNQYSVHMYHLKEKEFPNESNLLFLCGKQMNTLPIPLSVLDAIFFPCVLTAL